MFIVTLAGPAVPPGEPTEVSPETFLLPGRWSHASEAVGIWVVGVQAWLHTQDL